MNGPAGEVFSIEKGKGSVGLPAFTGSGAGKEKGGGKNEGGKKLLAHNERLNDRKGTFNNEKRRFLAKAPFMSS
jgi:hypothetical protein